MMLTLRPRLSSRQPMDAAASPLPNDETTPPVTKMYLAGMVDPLNVFLGGLLGLLMEILQPGCCSLATGHWQLAADFGGCCAPIGILVGLGPAGVHDLLYRNSGG